MYDQIGEILSTKDWKYDYRTFALQKAQMARREKMNLTELLEHPLLLQEGDTIYKGGVYGDGIAVGVSGVSEDVDEEIAEIILNNIFVFAKQTFDIVRQQEPNFLESAST